MDAPYITTETTEVSLGLNQPNINWQFLLMRVSRTGSLYKAVSCRTVQTTAVLLVAVLQHVLQPDSAVLQQGACAGCLPNTSHNTSATAGAAQATPFVHGSSA